jgi:hypothetical protein
MAETQHTGGSSRQHRHPQAAAGTTRIEAQAARASNDTEQTPIQSQGVVPQAGQQEVEDDWEVGEYEDEAEGEDTDWSEQLLAELLEDGQQVRVSTTRTTMCRSQCCAHGLNLRQGRMVPVCRW